MTKPLTEFVKREPARPKKPASRNREVVAALNAYIALRDNCAKLGVTPPDATPIVDLMESLPVEEEDCYIHGTVGFVYVDAGWYPVHVLTEGERGWCQYRINLRDGSCESGVARKYWWAHVTLDHTPCYHWFDLCTASTVAPTS